MTEADSEEFPGPYEVIEVEWIEAEVATDTDRNIIPRTRLVKNGVTGTLVKVEDGYQIQDMRRPSGGPDVLPTLVASRELSRAFDSDGSDIFQLGPIVSIEG
jgi:hypothetical protein